VFEALNETRCSYLAIVFDFGGVLIDWNPRYLYRQYFDTDEAVEEFLTEIGFAEWNLQQDKGRPFALAITELSRQFPQHARLIRAYDERWEESLGGPIQPVVEIAWSLKQAGHPLYGLSNWSAETFQRTRHKYAFFDWFELIVISWEAQLVKPDPRLFALFLTRACRTAQDCLFIDDSDDNIAAARRLGFQTIRFECAEQLERELSHRGLLTPIRNS
jgi:2-haloacid dehalogenase